MDSRALGKAIGMQPGTINAWVQRGYVPPLSVEISGRRRDFDIQSATHIAIMFELMPFGFDALLASAAAGNALAALKKGYPCCLIANGTQNSARPSKESHQASVPPEVQQSFEIARAAFTPPVELGQKLKLLVQPIGRNTKVSALLQPIPNDLKPGAFVIIDAGRITAKMQQAEKEWRQQRRKTRARKRG